MGGIEKGETRVVVAVVSEEVASKWGAPPDTVTEQHSQPHPRDVLANVIIPIPIKVMESHLWEIRKPRHSNPLILAEVWYYLAEWI